MSTLIKIIVTSILSLSLCSCHFNFGVKGNGNVISKERTIEGSFDAIEISHGLELYLTQNDQERVTVQADENLHAIIVTKVENNILKIYAEENINTSEAKKVLVTFSHIAGISASSGSEVYGTSLITEPRLEIQTSSGADMDLNIKVHHLIARTSSGADLKVSGVADTLTAQASSGGNINARHLSTLIAHAQATSGGDIVVRTSKELSIKTASGGDITYLGNPEKINTSENNR